MIPTSISDWLNGGPWLITRDDFFRKAEGVVYQGKEKPSAFTIQNGRMFDNGKGMVYEDRSIHEIAHLICCSDADIFDPYWGVQEFNFDDGSKNGMLLGLEASKKEIEVVCVQERIEVHTERTTLTQSMITPRYMYPLSRSGNTIPEGISEYDFVIRQCNQALSRWSIRTIWAELQRKYALIASQL